MLRVDLFDLAMTFCFLIDTRPKIKIVHISLSQSGQEFWACVMISFCFDYTLSPRIDADTGAWVGALSHSPPPTGYHLSLEKIT